MYVCTYVRMYVRNCVRASIRTYVNFTDGRTDVHQYLCHTSEEDPLLYVSYVCMCVCTYVRMYVCMYVCFYGLMYFWLFQRDRLAIMAEWSELPVPTSAPEPVQCSSDAKILSRPANPLCLFIYFYLIMRDKVVTKRTEKYCQKKYNATTQPDVQK